MTAHLNCSSPFPPAVNAEINQGLQRRIQNNMRRQMMKKKSYKMGKSKGKGSGSYRQPIVDPQPTLDEDCTFVFKYNEVVAFQVENGEILEYEQIQNSDSSFITICEGNNCAGEPVEVVGTTTGRCVIGTEDVLEFTIATAEDPEFLDFQVYCPDITWVGGGECLAIDIFDTQPLDTNPVLNVLGPEILITNIQFESLIRCRIVCTPRL